MNDSSGNKYKSAITKNPEEPIDLKAIYEKVKKQKGIIDDEAGIIEDNAGITEEIVTTEEDDDIIEDDS